MDATTDEFDPARFIANLEAAHTFPGPFMMKVLGDAGPEFEAAVRAVVVDCCPEGGPTIERRETRTGKYVGLTLTLQVASGADVLELYRRFGALDGVRLVI